MDAYKLLVGFLILIAGVMVGYNLPEPVSDDTVVVGTPTYRIDGYMINFKEPSAYGEAYDTVGKDSMGYTDKDKYIVIKSYESLNSVDETCVHEVAHNQNPERYHPETESSPWFDRQERLTSRDVCDKLKKKLLEDSNKFLREQ